MQDITLTFDQPYDADSDGIRPAGRARGEHAVWRIFEKGFYDQPYRLGSVKMIYQIYLKLAVYVIWNT